MLDVAQMRIDTEKAERAIKQQREREAQAADNLKKIRLKEFKESLEEAIRKAVKMGKWCLPYDVPYDLCYELMNEYPELKPSEVSKTKDTVRVKFTWEH
jgi:hypothetical protein